ncbi:MAG: DUF2079 domain-containing protein [Candidatus Omnitrophica bacterium]|nr:DUF2079 domain-containing protein [Candidatus Omnitrophota bacterium]
MTVPLKSQHTLLDFCLFFAALITAFFLLTNGIPLVQMGLMHELRKKNDYENLMRYSLSGFAILMILLRWKFSERFRGLQIAQIWKKINTLPLGAILGTLFFLYVSLMSFNGFIRHEVMATRAFDLGIFSQAVWTTMKGHFLFSSIKGDICLLGDHVSPILAAVVPFYALWSDPKCLLLLQAIASGSCLFLIGSWAFERTGDKTFAVLLAVIYFFFLPTRSALHEDFHPEVLIEPFLLLSFFALERKRISQTILYLIPVWMAKENMAGITLMMGIYAWAAKKGKRFSFFLIFFSLALFAVSIRWIVPHFNHGQYFYQENYRQFTSNPFSGILQSLLRADAWEYVLKLLSPLLFLPLFHFPTLMLAFPILFQNILSQNPLMLSLSYHYTIGMAPFLFISATEGFRGLIQRHSHPLFRRWLLGLLIFIGLIRSGPSEYFFIWKDLAHATPHTEMVKRKLREIPQNASVLTHNNFIPQLANRFKVYQFEYSGPLTKLKQVHQLQPDYVILDKLYWENEGFEATLSELQEMGYRTAFHQETFYLFKRMRDNP